MFAAGVYIERRRRLSQLVGSGVVVFLGNDESPMNYADNPYAFRQDSSFLYYFGLDLPGLVAVIDIDRGVETVFGEDLTVEQIVWMGPRFGLSERCREVGVQQTAGLADLPEMLKKAVQQKRTIHLLPQYRPENISKVQRLLDIPAGAVAGYISPALIKAVVAQRSVKAAEEIGQIEAALEITCQMHITAMKMTRPGVYERQVVGAMEGIARSMGGQIAFPVIFSVQGQILHNHYYGNVMKPGQMAVNDCGAESALHYASDITRTIPVGGRFSGRQKEIYNLVLKAQEQAIDAIRPGVAFRDVHLLACRVITGGLKELGLISGDIDEAVNVGAHSLFLPCGLGHMVGLDVHDMEALGEDYVGYTDSIRRSPQFGLRSLRLAKELQPGFVVTVEPGIYFIPQLIDCWRAERKHIQYINYDAVEKYRDFGGIRLEDDVLVMDTGCRMLGKKIPKTIEEVEAAAGQE
jgi:Xaa-Pro aminopeptidase